MKTIRQTYQLRAPIDKVWEAFVNPRVISQWGAGPAKMNTIEGDNFSLWGGEIYGKNIEVIPQKLLKQEWYTKDHKQKTMATFTFSFDTDITTVELIHDHVPENEYDDLRNGWNEYYFGPMKALIER